MTKVMSLPKLDYNHSMSEQLLVGATRDNKTYQCIEWHIQRQASHECCLRANCAQIAMEDCFGGCPRQLGDPPEVPVTERVDCLAVAKLLPSFLWKSDHHPNCHQRQLTWWYFAYQEMYWQWKSHQNHHRHTRQSIASWHVWSRAQSMHCHLVPDN